MSYQKTKMNFYKVIYSLSMGTGRLMTLLSFPLPEATNRRPSGIWLPKNGQVPTDHIFTLHQVSPVAWGTHRKASFVRPQIFSFGQPQLVTLHVSRLHRSPTLHAWGRSRRVLLGALQESQSKCSRSWQHLEAGTPGPPENPSLSGFLDSSLGACFLEHRKASFSGAGRG